MSSVKEQEGRCVSTSSGTQARCGNTHTFIVPGDSEAVGAEPTATGCDHALVNVVQVQDLQACGLCLKPSSLTGGVFPNDVLDYENSKTLTPS